VDYLGRPGELATANICIPEASRSRSFVRNTQEVR
jgi:hypothetical protein